MKGDLEIKGRMLRRKELDYYAGWLVDLIKKAYLKNKIFSEDPIAFVGFYKKEHDYYFNNTLKRLYNKIGLKDLDLYWFLTGYIHAVLESVNSSDLSADLEIYFKRIFFNKEAGIVANTWVKHLVASAMQMYNVFFIDPIGFTIENFNKFNIDNSMLLNSAFYHTENISFQNLTMYVSGFLLKHHSDNEKFRIISN